jgi:uncharacterized protein
MIGIRYEWDEKKALKNLAKHGVSFAVCERFDWHKAIIHIDDRQPYGEERRLAIGPIDGRYHALVYTRRNRRVRIISLRKANEREIERHEKERKKETVD